MNQDRRLWKRRLESVPGSTANVKHLGEKKGTVGGVEKVHLTVILSPPRRTKDLASQKGLRIEILRFAQNDGRSRAAAFSKPPVSHILRDHQVGIHNEGGELPVSLLEMVLPSVYPAIKEAVLSLG